MVTDEKGGNKKKISQTDDIIGKGAAWERKNLSVPVFFPDYLYSLERNLVHKILVFCITCKLGINASPILRLSFLDTSLHFSTPGLVCSWGKESKENEGKRRALM